MKLYRRATDAELESMPREHQAPARAFRAYMDAVCRGADREQLQLLGLVLEWTLFDSEDWEVALAESGGLLLCPGSRPPDEVADAASPRSPEAAPKAGARDQRS